MLLERVACDEAANTVIILRKLLKLHLVKLDQNRLDLKERGL